MWREIFGGILASALCAAAAAPAVSAPHGSTAGSCRVIDGDKLPKDAGGVSSICSAVERAVAAKAPNARYSAQVRVVSRSGLAVNVEVNGRKLDEQHYSVMDRNLNPRSIEHFAEAIADSIAEAAKKR